MSSSFRDREEASRRARGVIVTHPNRDKPVVQSTRVVVVLLLLATALLILVITVGGWNTLEGPVPIQLVFILVYLLMAFYAARWRQGVLPIGSALSVMLGIFALVAGPGWFERNKAGFAHPTLNAGLLGVLTLLIVPVQILFVTFAMRGFKQGWNVERERHDPSVGDPTHPGPTGPDLYPDAPPHPA